MLILVKVGVGFGGGVVKAVGGRTVVNYIFLWLEEDDV